MEHTFKPNGQCVTIKRKLFLGSLKLHFKVELQKNLNDIEWTKHLRIDDRIFLERFQWKLQDESLDWQNKIYNDQNPIFVQNYISHVVCLFG